MATKQQPEFNKVDALDELMKQMQTAPNPTVSQSIKVLMDAQNFLQKIYDDGFELGFNLGSLAKKKVDEI